jgi:hypothetical protein
MDPAGVLYAVDPFEPGRLGFSLQRVIARREIRRVRGGKVNWVRLSGARAADQVLRDGPVDLIFIDGDHSYEGLRSDWEAWSAGTAPDALIALHDSVSSSSRNIEDAGSVRYTRETIAKDPRFRRIRTVETLTFWSRSI